MKLSSSATVLAVLAIIPMVLARPTEGPRIGMSPQPLLTGVKEAGNSTCQSDAGSSSARNFMRSTAAPWVTMKLDESLTNGNFSKVTTISGTGSERPASDQAGKKATIEVIVVVKDDGKQASITATLGNATSNMNATSSTNSSPSIHSGAEVMRPRCAVASTNSSKISKLEAENRRLISQWRNRNNSLKGANSHIKVIEGTNATVPVYWHVITDRCKGHLDSNDLKRQINTLNADYGKHGFSFVLRNVSYVENAKWFHSSYDSDESEKMKIALRQGDSAKALNIYSVRFQDGTLGFATFPWDYADSPKMDGVVVQFNTVPGGGLANYNQGRTVTHEVGHWLGLYHTFEGGCTSPGDYVKDTPPSASPSSGCPTKRNSCSGDSLEDPVHNYMDYSYDSCMHQFTDGQTARMQALSSKYRGL